MQFVRQCKQSVIAIANVLSMNHREKRTMNEYETLTDELIRKLNTACKTLRESGKCGDEYECFCIGWCSDVWAACDYASNSNSGNETDTN